MNIRYVNMFVTLKFIIKFLNGFRKLSFSFFLVLVGVTLLTKGYLEGKEFVSLIAPVGVAFMGANGIEHTCKAVIAWLEVKSKNS